MMPTQKKAKLTNGKQTSDNIILASDLAVFEDCLP